VVCLADSALRFSIGEHTVEVREVSLQRRHATDTRDTLRGVRSGTRRRETLTESG